MKNLNKAEKTQTRGVDTKTRNEIFSQSASSADCVTASGWLDILGKAAKGALGAVMG